MHELKLDVDASLHPSANYRHELKIDVHASLLQSANHRRMS
jgi:hypothetical protein